MGIHGLITSLFVRGARNGQGEQKAREFVLSPTIWAAFMSNSMLNSVGLLLWFWKQTYTHPFDRLDLAQRRNQVLASKAPHPRRSPRRESGEVGVGRCLK